MASAGTPKRTQRLSKSAGRPRDTPVIRQGTDPLPCNFKAYLKKITR